MNKRNHFVIVANGDFLPADDLQQLLQGKTVLALDGAIDKLHQLGLKADSLLGDFDSISDLDHWQQQDITIHHRPDQSLTDLQKGIDHCDQLQASVIEIVCATSHSRMDHNLGNLRCLRSRHRVDRPLYLHTAHETIQFIKDDRCVISGKPGDPCGILAFPEASFSSTGLVWNGDNHALHFGNSDSTCNRFTSSQAIIDIHGEALITAPRQNALSLESP